jgi:hypothetical protein
MNCDSSKIGLAIFSFNRPQHLGVLYKTIQDLKLENRYCFHLFNDGPKISESPEIRLVRSQTDEFTGSLQNFEISRRTENLGLAKSIRLGLDSVFAKHKKAIVLEDDIIPSSEFFQAMEFFLTTLEENPKIGTITGANTTKFPFFVRKDFLASKRHSSWGWATWADRWVSIDWDTAEKDFLLNRPLIRKVKRVSPDLFRYAGLQELGMIDSWAATMNIDFIDRGMLCVVPHQNLITNIGLDGSGTHNSSKHGRQKSRGFTKPRIQLNVFDPIIYESNFYDLLVKLDNSLLRDFPRGTVTRLILKVKNFPRKKN